MHTTGEWAEWNIQISSDLVLLRKCCSDAWCTIYIIIVSHFFFCRYEIVVCVFQTSVLLVLSSHLLCMIVSMCGLSGSSRAWLWDYSSPFIIPRVLVLNMCSRITCILVGTLLYWLDHMYTGWYIVIRESGNSLRFFWGGCGWGWGLTLYLFLIFNLLLPFPMCQFSNFLEQVEFDAVFSLLLIAVWTGQLGLAFRIDTYTQSRCIQHGSRAYYRNMSWLPCCVCRR